MFELSRGKIVVTFGRHEAELMRHTIDEYVHVLDSGTPLDPVNRRLFPSAGAEDEEVARTYRDLTFTELDEHKRATVTTAMTCLGERGGCKVDLSLGQQEAWLMLLTDLRLAIGTRLGVTEEMMEREPNPEQDWNLALLHYLGALQESLLHASEINAR